MTKYNVPLIIVNLLFLMLFSSAVIASPDENELRFWLGKEKVVLEKGTGFFWW